MPLQLNDQVVDKVIRLNLAKKAIVTAGYAPFGIKASFKVNKCSGYLQNEKSIQFILI